MENEIILTPAEKAYQRIKDGVSTYQKKYPEKCKEKNKKWMDKLKENEEQYKIYLQKKKDYYNNVVKPKREQAKKDKELNNQPL